MDDRNDAAGSEEAAREAAEAEMHEASHVDTTAPERVVVLDPPPDPDYPRYRVEPGHWLKLAQIDADESEHYARKKDVEDDLDTSG